MQQLLRIFFFTLLINNSSDCKKDPQNIFCIYSTKQMWQFTPANSHTERTPHALQSWGYKQITGVKHRSECHYLLINILHTSIKRSLGRREVRTPPTTLEMFFFICSRVIAFSSITRPVRIGLYSLHSSTHFTITIHWIRNGSNNNKSGSGSTILFKQKSMTGGRTDLSPNE